jgi:chromate transporter
MPEAAGLRQPHGAADILRVFNRMALQGFGGVLAVAQRELVERERWMTPAQFLELLSLGQVLPGPNIVNMALIIGHRFHGWRGAAAALAGLLCVPLVIVLLLAVLYRETVSHPMVAGALRGMGAVAAGLVIGTAFKLVGGLRTNPLGRPAAAGIALLALLAIGVWRWPMVGVVLGLGGASVALAWWRLGR